MSIYFISGHVDISHREFLTHYKDALDVALQDPRCSFVVGESNGVDLFAQNYLGNHGCFNVTVYHCGRSLKNNPHSFHTKGNFKSHEEKDKAMTYNSTHDILYIRSKEATMQLYGAAYRPRISGTEKNYLRREALKKELQISLVEKRNIPGLPPSNVRDNGKLLLNFKNTRKKTAATVVDSENVSKETAESHENESTKSTHTTDNVITVVSLKNLRKKLADIQQLMLRDVSTLNCDQLSKISRREALEEQISLLEFSESVTSSS